MATVDETNNYLETFKSHYHWKDFSKHQGRNWLAFANNFVWTKGTAMLGILVAAFYSHHHNSNLSFTVIVLYSRQYNL